MRRFVLIGIFLLILSVTISHGFNIKDLLNKKLGKEFGGTTIQVSRNP